MSGIKDTWIAPQKQYGGILCFCSVGFFYIEEVVNIYFNCIGFGSHTVYPWYS